MEYLWLKYVHIISSTFLFGTGVGSAFYMFRANISREPHSIYFAARNVALADWLFTTPTIIIQPVTGVIMMYIAGYSLTDFWIIASFALYFLAGICWLPVVWLQIRMRDVAKKALESGTELPPLYWKFERIWFWLGVIAFPALVLVFYLMVFKPV